MAQSLRDEAGMGVLSFLDSVRHSFEQAAWGQEGSGHLVNDFYHQVGAADAPDTKDAAAGREGKEGPADDKQRQFEAWLDGRHEPRAERAREVEQERDGPGLGE